MQTPIEIYFHIPGKPATAGSKRGIPFHKKDGRLGVRLLHACERFESWRVDVQTIASRSLPDDFTLHEGAVKLAMHYYTPRPKSHYRTGKNAGMLRDGMPYRPIGKPDLTKILRALEDSLTGVVWRDDSQVVAHDTCKRYGSPERLEVFIVCWDGALG